MKNQFAEIILKALESRTSGVVVTVVSSVPDCLDYVPGFKTLVYADGNSKPIIPHGRLSDAIYAGARQTLASGKRQLCHYSLDGKPVNRRATDSISIYYEPLALPDRLIIVGAGHIAIPICQIASILGFQVTVIDDRSDYANGERFPQAVEVVAADFTSALSRLTIDSETYIILVTRAHAFDELALRHIANSNARYIGMIGSRRRVLIVCQNLVASGVSPDVLHKVYAPIGVDLGAETVEEIALASVAEVIKVKRGGCAKSLRIADWQNAAKNL